MDLGKGLGHLTYSTLVHQTDNWDQLWKSVNTYLPAVKARVAPHEKFGVCLRTSAPSIELLSTEPGKVADLKQFFADQDLYLYTANAFVYGVFKKQVIKEDVYEPDWATPERREYTKKVANLLAELAPEGVNPSIQTAPLGFKPKVTGDDVVEAYTSNVIDVVAHLVDLKKRTGKTVTLGLEPEPRCYLETTDETITYFKNRLFSGETAKRLAQKTGLNEADAAQAMRSYMGVVFDIGHQSVGYEDIPASLQKLVDNGVQIVKLQEAASMHIPDVTQDKVDALQTFAKTIYLSQTCQKKDGKMTWFLNLEDAFEDWSRNPGPREWRTHF
ncbi:MAG TPA: metabolite traffic protein EboE, partial [Vicinamibacterales bacterium]|nr:metabolite traffic protein EboE [Vicinamibacterales bacterium]